MAYRRRSQRRRPFRKARRRTKKRYGRKRKTRFTRQTGIGFPQQSITKMRYAFHLHADQTPTTPTNPYVIRGNSIFDPDQSGVGHQPMTHDQWAVIYRRYRVYSSKLEIWAMCSTSIWDDCPLIVVKIDTDPTPELSIGSIALDQIYERNGFYKLKVNNVDQGKPMQKLTVSSSTKKAFGIKKPEGSNNVYSAAFGNNSVNVWYYKIYLIKPNADGNGGYYPAPIAGEGYNINIHARVTYNVMMYDRLQLDRS